MKQGDYRKQSEGKKVRFRRMPPPDQMKMGSRPFDDENEEESNVVQCPTCSNWVEESEIDRNGLCPYCPVESKDD